MHVNKWVLVLQVVALGVQSYWLWDAWRRLKAIERLQAETQLMIDRQRKWQETYQGILARWPEAGRREPPPSKTSNTSETTETSEGVTDATATQTPNGTVTGGYHHRD